MDDLFAPFTIQAIELKNRIVMPALASFLIGDDGSISDATVEHYRRRAAGGVGQRLFSAHSRVSGNLLPFERLTDPEHPQLHGYHGPP